MVRGYPGGNGRHGQARHLRQPLYQWPLLGLYDLGERPDGSYGAHYFGGQKSDYDAFSGPDE